MGNKVMGKKPHFMKEFLRLSAVFVLSAAVAALSLSCVQSETEPQDTEFVSTADITAEADTTEKTQTGEAETTEAVTESAETTEAVENTSEETGVAAIDVLALSDDEIKTAIAHHLEIYEQEWRVYELDGIERGACFDNQADRDYSLSETNMEGVKALIPFSEEVPANMCRNESYSYYLVTNFSSYDEVKHYFEKYFKDSEYIDNQVARFDVWSCLFEDKLYAVFGQMGYEHDTYDFDTIEIFDKSEDSFKVRFDVWKYPEDRYIHTLTFENIDGILYITDVKQVSEEEFNDSETTAIPDVTSKPADATDTPKSDDPLYNAIINTLSNPYKMQSKITMNLYGYDCDTIETIMYDGVSYYLSSQAHVVLPDRWTFTAPDGQVVDFIVTDSGVTTPDGLYSIEFGSESLSVPAKEFVEIYENWYIKQADGGWKDYEYQYDFIVKNNMIRNAEKTIYTVTPDYAEKFKKSVMSFAESTAYRTDDFKSVTVEETPDGTLYTCKGLSSGGVKRLADMGFADPDSISWAFLVKDGRLVSAASVEGINILPELKLFSEAEDMPMYAMSYSYDNIAVTPPTNFSGDEVVEIDWSMLAGFFDNLNNAVTAP